MTLRNFGAKLKKKIGLGAERQRNIPLEIKLIDGSTCTDRKVVLNIWKKDFSSMLKSDHNVYVENENKDILDVSDDFLDCDTTMVEVLHVLKKAKT